MMHKYCLETERHWGKGLAFLLFAAHKAKQISLSFIPAELLFGHNV